MYHPSKEEFLKLAKRGNLIPVYKEILADLETPVSAFLKYSFSEDYTFLLESVEGEEKIARFSFLGSNPKLIFKSKERSITVETKEEKRNFTVEGDPLTEIEKMMADYKFVSIEGLPRFCGGFVGFMGYDTVRFYEEIPDKNRDDLGIWDCLFLLIDKLIIFDHRTHKIKIVVNVFLEDFGDRVAAYRYAVEAIEEICKKLKSNLYSQGAVQNLRRSTFKITSNFTKGEFKRIVLKAKDYIRKDEVIQVVLSQRFKMRLRCEPFAIYRNLRSLNPSPYMYYLKLKDFYLIGSSPETLVRCEDFSVLTRPIAGTRPRGRNETEDRRLESELSKSTKDRAEHLMLVDLGRNDLNRVCKPESVKVKEFMEIEKYSHVMHLVSEVTGILNRGKSIFELLRVVFPAGTVTGAPKVRAMQIIEELENLKRSIYAGCVGYFSFSGNLDTCITIRTILIKGNYVYIQAGAGIVADSKPESEYLEIRNKAKVLLEVLKGEVW